MEEYKQNPGEIWKDYENGKAYKSSENLYNIIARNERYYAGDQWKGVKDSGLNPTTLNFLEQLVDVKVSSIMANQLTIHRKPDELSESNQTVELATKAFQLADKKNWERVKMDTMNEEMLLDAAISGLGISYWYWDESLITGNDFLEKGDFKGELIDSINLYVSNPNERDIQKQDWVIISLRKTVKQIQSMARNLKLSEDKITSIKGDEDVVYEGYDKAQNEQDNKLANNQITLLLRFWKNPKTNTIYFCKTTKDLILLEEDTELERYPIAVMPWKIRKRFIYGNAELTYIIANQQHVNKMESIRQLHAQLMGIPKLAFNKNMIAGVTNQAGAILPIDAQPGEDISKALHYFQPTSMSVDVDKSIENTIMKTREFKGVNDNVVGASDPKNTSAIIAQQKAAGVPLESIKRRFWQYLEDVALIWLDFYQHKYKMTRKLKDEEGNLIEFTGTALKDIYLKTSIDVGASTQWSEVLSAQILMDLLAGQHINKVQFIERYPKNVIPDQEKLKDEFKEEMMIQQQSMQPDMTQQYEQMAQLLEGLPPDIQQQLQSLPPDQMEQELMRMMQGGGASA